MKRTMTTISETLRQYLEDEIAKGASLRRIERESDVRRQSIVKFIDEEQSIRLNLADKLADRYGLELRPKKLKAGSSNG